MADIGRFQRDFPDVCAAAKILGWTVSGTNGGHVRVAHPSGHPAVVTSSTTGDRRARRNFLAELRRQGFDIHAVKEKVTVENPYVHYKNTEPSPLAANVPGVNKYMTRKEAVEFLGAREFRPDELKDWTEAGYIHLAKRDDVDGRAHFYLRSEVEEFAKSEEYRTLHVPKRTYKKHTSIHEAEPESDLHAPVDADARVRPIEDAPIEAVRAIIYRRSTELTTIDELATALVEAMKPKMREILVGVVKDLLKGLAEQ